MVSFLEDLMLTDTVLEVAEMRQELKAAKQELKSKGVSDRTLILAMLEMLVGVSYVSAKEVVANGNDPIDVAVCAELVRAMTVLLDLSNGIKSTDAQVREPVLADEVFEEIF